MIFSTIPIDTPTILGRIYSKQLIKKIIKENQHKVDNKTLFVYTNFDTNLETIIGNVEKMYIENKQLFIKIKILNTSEKISFFNDLSKQSFLNLNVSCDITPFGIGSVDIISNVVLDDYRLSGFHIELKPQFNY